jgi:hypothetical protein
VIGCHHGMHQKFCNRRRIQIGPLLVIVPLWAGDA